MLNLKVGDIVTLDIGVIAHGGHFIAKHENQVIFVRHAITGEIANVKITSIKSKLAFGDAIEIIQPSIDRVQAPCQYSRPSGCGGCDFQHISFKAQKDLKKIIIKDQFMRIANLNVDPNVLSVEPQSGLYWRSRVDFAISEKGKVGLYSHKSKNITEIKKCLIAVEKINQSEVFTKNWDGNKRLSIAVSSENELSINSVKKNLSKIDQLKEVVGEETYLVSPKSFWQSHKLAPILLTEQVINYANIKLGNIVCDLYGGVGLFTSPISKLIGDKGEIHLIERDNDCINDAKKMFKNKKNITIHHGRVEQKLGKIKNIDVIILDPPRNGVSKQVIKEIINKNPISIVYVSCDPVSLARDTKILVKNNYALNNLVGLDLFPMTHHIECVALFNKQ